MPEFTKHAPGAFSWVELSTTDQKGGVQFYRGLFGWDVDEQPMGPGETYSMLKLRGLETAAAYTMRPEEKQMGAPPHWNMYVTVDNADASAARAKELGGNVPADMPSFWLPYFLVEDVDRSSAKATSLGGSIHFGPMDIPNAGRFAVIADPQGAAFAVYTPKR